MTFDEFKDRYLAAPVREHPNRLPPEPPLVTVRLLVYNHAPFLRACLDSILGQSCRYPFELLIAEDESNDGSREICLDYAERHPGKIRLLLNDRRNNLAVNGTPSGIFNSIYSNFVIRSKYIALCEADDYWTDPLSLEKRVDFLERHPAFTMCYHNAVPLLRGASTPENDFKYHDDAGAPLAGDCIVLYGPVPPTPTILYRRDLIEVADESLLRAVCGDCVLHEKLRHHGPCAFLAGIGPAVQRHHAGSAFKARGRKAMSRMTIDTYEALLTYFRSKRWDDHLLRLELAERHYWHVRLLSAPGAGESLAARLAAVGAFLRRLAATGRHAPVFLFQRLVRLRLRTRLISAVGAPDPHVVSYHA